MVHILDLPDEILIQIARRVSGLDTSDRTLARFCQVNRRISNIIDEVCYRGLQTRNHSTSGAKFCTFAQYIAKHSERRLGMRRIQLEFVAGCEIPALSNFDDLRREAPRYFQGELELKWRSGQRICTYPHISALLSLLPCVESLRLRSPSCTRHRSELPNIPRALDYLAVSLRELCLEGPSIAWRDNAFPFPAIATLRDLPRLETLKLKYINESVYFRGPDDHNEHSIVYATNQNISDKASLPIEQIVIDACSVQHQYLWNLLYACRRITCFHYWSEDSCDDWSMYDLHDDDELSWGDQEDEGSFEESDTQGWYEALVLHRDSLREIVLDFSGRLRSVITHLDSSPWPSFADFRSLVVLQIEYSRFRSAHMPSSLQRLRLFDCGRIENDTEIEDWKCIKSTYCPNIERFQIEVTHNTGVVHRLVKYSGFQWDVYHSKTRVWRKGGFDLAVRFLEWSDRDDSYYTDGSWDTGSVNSDGVKLDASNDEDWEPNNGEGNSSTSQGDSEDEKFNSEEEVAHSGGWDEESQIREYLEYKDSLGEDGTTGYVYSFLDTDEDSDEGYEAEVSDSGGD